MAFLESLPGNGISPTGQLEEIVEPTDLVKGTGVSRSRSGWTCFM